MERKERIGTILAFCIVSLALLFDGAQFLFNFIPIAGQVIGMFLAFIAFLIFTLWFSLLGVKYFDGKKAALKLCALFCPLVVEIIPIINDLPAISLGVIVIIGATRLEDKEFLSKVTSTLTRFNQRRAAIAPLRRKIQQTGTPKKTIPNSEKIAA